MGLFERFAHTVAGPTEPVLPPQPRPITAAGARIDLTQPLPLSARRTQWQDAAWAYRDTVPELQFVASFVRSSLGRLRVFPAERQPRNVNPQPLETQPDGGAPKLAGDPATKPASQITAATRRAALLACERLNLDRNGSMLFGRLGENLEFAGEAYLLGEQADPNDPSEGENWSIRSVSEVQIGVNTVRLIEPGTGRGGRELDPNRCELLRLWNPHPRYHEWPDSPIAALLETCEAMVLLSRRGRAHDRSRISSGKALFLPDELSLHRAGGAPVDPATGVFDDTDPFMTELAAFMTEPIADEADPSAVVPLVIRGPAMMGDVPMKNVIGTVDLHNEDPHDLDTRRDNLVAVLARGIDLPPEVLTGVGDTNHWNGAVISAETVQSHIEPRAQRMCDSLTVAYLWPALKAMGIPRSEREKVCLWYDPSELMQDPDVAQAAKDAHQALAISDATLRRALGFTDEDKPDATEKLMRTLTEGRAYQASIPALIALSGMDLKDPKVQRVLQLSLAANNPQAAPADTTDGADAAGNAAGPNGRPPEINRAADRTPNRQLPSRSAPAPANAPVRASAQREKVHTRASVKLGRIDHDLTVKLLTHADATVGRAVEKAANRLRSQAQRNPVTASAFPKGADPRAVLAERGRALTAGLDEDAALAGGLDDFAVQYDRDTAAAAQAVEDTVASIVGADKAKGLADRLIQRSRVAWQWLKGKLADRVRQVLYGEAGTSPGESSADFVPASLIRGAVAQLGGLPEGSSGVADDGTLVRGPGDPVRPAAGPGTGIEVMDIMRGADAAVQNWRWDYPANPRAHFEPHKDLDGVEFGSWTDPVLDAGANAYWIGPQYHPGDHSGCMCFTTPLWSTPVKTPELTEVG
jgi:hypothetical protein